MAAHGDWGKTRLALYVKVHGDGRGWGRIEGRW